VNRRLNCCHRYRFTCKFSCYAVISIDCTSYKPTLVSLYGKLLSKNVDREFRLDPNVTGVSFGDIYSEEKQLEPGESYQLYYIYPHIAFTPVTPEPEAKKLKGGFAEVLKASCTVLGVGPCVSAKPPIFTWPPANR